MINSVKASSSANSSREKNRGAVGSAAGSCSAVNAATPKNLKTSRRFSAVSISHLALPELIRQVVTGAPAQSHDCPGWILAGGGNESAAIHYEEILDIVRLLVLIE